MKPNASDNQQQTYRFAKTSRLRNSAEYDQVFRRRCSRADQNIILYARLSSQQTTPPSSPRLGLNVSRKCGNAVQRNRWKRTLREAFRLLQYDLPAGIDFIVIPRPQATPQVAQLKKSLCQLGWQLQKILLAENPQPRA